MFSKPRFEDFYFEFDRKDSDKMLEVCAESLNTPIVRVIGIDSENVMVGLKLAEEELNDFVEQFEKTEIKIKRDNDGQALYRYLKVSIKES